MFYSYQGRRMSHTVKLKNSDVTIGMMKKITKISTAGRRNHKLYIFFLFMLHFLSDFQMSG